MSVRIWMVRKMRGLAYLNEVGFECLIRRKKEILDGVYKEKRDA